jgi:hypothetical protein
MKQHKQRQRLATNCPEPGAETAETGPGTLAELHRIASAWLEEPAWMADVRAAAGRIQAARAAISGSGRPPAEAQESQEPDSQASES